MSAKKDTIGFTIFVYAVLFFFVLLVLIPVIWVISTAFRPTQTLTDTDGSVWPAEPTFKNFRYILTEGPRNADGSLAFYTWLKNSLICAAGTTLLGLVLSTTAAYAFSRFQFALKKPGLMAFVIVQMFPGAIIIIPYYNLMQALGLIDSLPGLILAYSVTSLPLCVWTMKGFFDKIPYELEEAAAIDGCSQFGIFWRIILPLSKPGLAVTALFSFMSSWNEFMLALTFNSSGYNYTLPVGITSFISGNHTDWANFAAMSVLVSIPVVFMFILFQKYLISGLTAGSVKG